MNVKWANINSFVGNSTRPESTMHRPCPVCSGHDSRLLLEINDFQFFTDSATDAKRVTIRENQCLNCFGIYLNPCYSPFGFSVLFAEAGQSYGSTEGRPQEQIDWMRQRGRLEAGMQVFDVGCYDGKFLATLPTNVRKVGVDIDEPAIERGRNLFPEHDIEFVLGDLESFNYDGKPDTITMFHVLEHVAAPITVLRKLLSISHDGTNLIVEVPILENGFTNDINGFFSVQHLTHFSRASLRNCFIRAGWNIVDWHEQPDYNGCRVTAIPNGTELPITPNANDLATARAYIAHFFTNQKQINESLPDLKAYKKAVIWGGGAHTEFIYHTTDIFQSSSDRLYIIVDSDPIKQNRSLRGIPIFHPSALAQPFDWSDTILIISSYGSQPEIKQAALELGVPAEKIIELYQTIRIY